MQAPDEDPLDPVRPASSRPGTLADAGSPASSTGGHAVIVSSGSTGGASGTGGTTATGGTASIAGAPGHACPTGGTLDCSSAGALRMTDGHITDFSSLDWDSATGQFCGAGGLRGRLFSFGGPNSSVGTAAVDTAAQNLTLNVATTTTWSGGGVIFESCVNAAAFTSVQFTARLSGGSLSGCTWQVQLQTQDQRAATDTDPTGGTCSGNCYGYPVATLAAPGPTATTYRKAFTAFNNPSGSNIPTNSQIVGVQWQVTSASPQGCSAELRIDDITFQ